jgi:hypothetical protein
MRKFISTTFLFLLLLGTLGAQNGGFSWMGPQAICGSFQFNTQSTTGVDELPEQTYWSPAASSERNYFSIIPEDPAMTQIVVGEGFGNSKNEAVAKVEYNPVSGKITIRWKKPGKYKLKQEYKLFLGFGTVYPTTYDVTASKSGIAHGWEVKQLNNCPAPYTSFKVQRLGGVFKQDISNNGPFIGTALNNEPITNWFLDITECTSNGVAVPGGAYWVKNGNGWTTGELNNFTINASTCNLNFQGGKHYSVKLAASTVCQTWIASTQTIYIKYGVSTPVININGSTATPVSANTCGNSTIMLNNTSSISADACGKMEIELYGAYGTDYTPGMSCGAYAYINKITHVTHVQENC